MHLCLLLFSTFSTSSTREPVHRLVYISLAVLSSVLKIRPRLGNLDSGIRNPESMKFCLRNPKSWALESGIQLKGSGIPLTIGIQNPSATDKEPGIQYLESGIWNSESLMAWNPKSSFELDSLT